MLINLTDVFTSEGKVKMEVFPYEHDSFSYMGNEYPIPEKTDVSITFTNIKAGHVLAEGEMELVLSIPCDRCLHSVKMPVRIVFTHQLKAPEQEKSALKEEDISESSPFLSGFELDTEILMNNEILINMPMKVLCKEECKGICPECGQNLNEGECGCDTFVPDPRMAMIKDIFNANKEV